MNITIGIPTYKCKNTIYKTLSSIQMQTISDKVEVILGVDDSDDYSEIISLFPNLKIKQVSTVKNSGPGVARQICLDNATSPYITFIDADDVFYTPVAIEMLLSGFNKPNVVVTQGKFLSNTMERTDIGHPWVFGRVYNVDFLRHHKISFSSLRAMEDGEFNAKIRMLIEGSPFEWNSTDVPVYYWSEGSEHSITRTGAELELEGKPKGLPLYNYGLCHLGSAICFKSAIDFVKKINPFNTSLMKTAAEIFIGNYFQYFECKEKAPVYLEQSEWVAAWFYHNCFKQYENLLTDDILQRMALPQFSRLSKMPDMTFTEWSDKLKDYDCSVKHLEEIRYRLPAEILELENKTGVVGNLQEQIND